MRNPTRRDRRAFIGCFDYLAALQCHGVRGRTGAPTDYPRDSASFVADTRVVIHRHCGGNGAGNPSFREARWALIIRVVINTACALQEAETNEGLTAAAPERVGEAREAESLSIMPALKQTLLGHFA